MILRIVSTALLMLAVVTMEAQNVWEIPDQKTTKQQAKQEKEAKEKAEEENPDAQYLAGAVTEENGKVVFTLDMDVPQKNAQQIYDIVFNALQELTVQENQLEGSAVALVNKQEHIIAANIREWLVFKNNFLSLDRAKFFYALIAKCSDGHLHLTMERLSYKYEEERGGRQAKDVIKAEELIADGVALNKKGTKIYRGYAKFRRKTIDRKNELFATISREVLK